MYRFAVHDASAKYHEINRINMVLQSPAALKVFSLQCDLFSMGKVTVEQNDTPLEEDPFLDLISNPNPFTDTESQFLWDFMFYNMLGAAYCYVDSKVVDGLSRNYLYLLEPHKIEWPESFRLNKDKLLRSKAEVKALDKTMITYRYDDGSTFEFPFDRLVICHDLTNAVGNFYKSPSRLDALCKIISNSEYILDSHNVNIRYTSKFMVGTDSKQGTMPGLGPDEKQDLIDNIDHSDRTVYPVRTKPTISRFVSDLAALQLPKEYMDQAFLIGGMYGIPRDVMELYMSATYENQEKARAAHVNYTLEPKGNQFMDAFEIHFGYKEQGKNIKISWKHLPFMQQFVKTDAEGKKVQVEVFNSLLAMGMSVDDANEYLDTNFKIDETKRQGAQTGQGEAQATPQGQAAPEESESGDTKVRRII